MKECVWYVDVGVAVIVGEIGENEDECIIFSLKEFIGCTDLIIISNIKDFVGCCKSKCVCCAEEVDSCIVRSLRVIDENFVTIIEYFDG